MKCNGTMVLDKNTAFYTDPPQYNATCDICGLKKKMVEKDDMTCDPSYFIIGTQFGGSYWDVD